MRVQPILEKKYLNENGFNPVHGFFGTDPNWGLTLVRLVLAIYLLFHGLQQSFGLLERVDLSHFLDYYIPHLGSENQWLIGAVGWSEIVAALFLFLGFLTRLISFLATAGIAWILFHVWPVLTPMEIQLNLLLATFFVVLLLGGAGKASLDGGISEQLLP